jgi:catechol 2,3-dioxygenase-like lactoylglutathione lyase family enzyme
MTRKQPLSRGVHHLALNTDDMKMTLDFYTRVLGMPLVHALKVPPGLGTGPANRGNPPFENLRHYFLDAGGDSLLAFFEMPKGATPKADRNAVGTMQHVSFAVTDDKFNEILAKIKKAGISYLGPLNVGVETWSIYFLDPNGIRLEFSHQKEADLQVVKRWTQTQAEALAELRTLSSDEAWLRSMVAHLPVSGDARRAGKPRTAPRRKRSSALRRSRAARPSRQPRTSRR